MKQAFSLMEIMVVVIILGLLASFVLPNLMGKSEEAKSKIVCIQMKSVAETIKMYRLDNSEYPRTEEGLKVLISKNYFEDGRIPKDAWTNEFIYILVDNNNFELISLGADKKENTQDDIYFSKCNK